MGLILRPLRFFWGLAGYRLIQPGFNGRPHEQNLLRVGLYVMNIQRQLATAHQIPDRAGLHLYPLA